MRYVAEQILKIWFESRHQISW